MHTEHEESIPETAKPYTKQKLYYHFVWTTWNRMPLMEGEVENRIHASIKRRCGEMGVYVSAIGGTSDHIHLFATIPGSICIDDFIRSLKDVSTLAVKRTYGSSVTAFRWQLGYTVQTVSACHRKKVRQYVNSQKENHQTGQLWDTCEPKSSKHTTQ